MKIIYYQKNDHVLIIQYKIQLKMLMFQIKIKELDNNFQIKMSRKKLIFHTIPFQ